MAKRTRKTSATTTTTTNSASKVDAPQVDGAVEVKTDAEGAENKREKTPQLGTEDPKNKYARGLQWPFSKGNLQDSVVASFNLANAVAVEGGERAQIKIARGQFAKRHFYYLYMASKAEEEARQYRALAEDAEAHPEKYAGTRESVKARIAQATQVAERKADALIQALAALGQTPEQIAEVLAQAETKS